MEKIYKRKTPSTFKGVGSSNGHVASIDSNDLPYDPSDWPRITCYNPNQRVEIKRHYLLRGPCQPRGHEFPTKSIGTKLRRFVPTWFDEFNWLEYSVKVDKAYCLYCYLFRDNVGNQARNDAFVTEGFNSLSKKDRLSLRVGHVVEEEGDNIFNRRAAAGIISYFKEFDFVFYLHLILHILGLTDLLSRALQKKDQDILEAVSLVGSTKRQLQKFREDGFDSLLEKIYTFCAKHGIEMVDMARDYVNVKSRRQITNITNQHHYEFDIFNTVLDMQIHEFGDLFSEVSTELLSNMDALSPCNSFSKFDASKLLKLSEFYPYDFDRMERMILELQLDIYFDMVQHDERFSNLNGITDLCRVMVEIRKHLSHPLVYWLLKLALVLPVATSTVERCFSTMKLVNTDLRNRISGDFLNASVICAVEKEALPTVTNEYVINRFQSMKNCREQV